MEKDFSLRIVQYIREEYVRFSRLSPVKEDAALALLSGEDFLAQMAQDAKRCLAAMHMLGASYVASLSPRPVGALLHSR